MERLRVENFGPIRKADITFGDLTLFVGPQATGKSVFLQLIKLLLDSSMIIETFSDHGYNWDSDTSNFMQLYFGEGMHNLWTQTTRVYSDEKPINLPDLLVKDGAEREQLFFIPAQRILTLSNGWTRSFSDFEIQHPYVVSKFSDALRLLIKTKFDSRNKSIFPQRNYFNQEFQETLNSSIFNDAKVQIETANMRKRIQLSINGNSLPFMAWSAGQREFLPLLLGFYWLMPAGQGSFLESVGWVAIEEMEMGLHPQAILSVILICLDLLHRGYRLLISTHSPVVLEAVWAIRFLQAENPDVKYLYQLFDLKGSPAMTELFEDILKNKNFFTYYFDRSQDGVIVRDISSLDPGDPDPAVADWGGLTGFSSRASDVVSQAVQEKDDL